LLRVELLLARAEFAERGSWASLSLTVAGVGLALLGVGLVLIFVALSLFIARCSTRSGFPRRRIGHDDGRIAGNSLRRSELAALEASARKKHLANLIVVGRAAMGVNVQTSSEYEAQAYEVRKEIDETIRKPAFEAKASEPRV
jgi:hypothetical protein